MIVLPVSAAVPDTLSEPETVAPTAGLAITTVGPAEGVVTTVVAATTEEATLLVAAGTTAGDATTAEATLLLGEAVDGAAVIPKVGTAEPIRL